MAALENVLVWADRVLLPSISSEGFVCVFVLFCFLMVCFYFLLHCIAWQKSNDPGTLSVLTIKKLQIVHRTFNRRLFSKCMLTWGMYDHKNQNHSQRQPFSDRHHSLLSSHRFTLCRVIH